MKRILSAALMVLAAVWCGSAQVSLAGKVVDKNGTPVANASVRLVGAGLTTTTSGQGDFSLTGATSVEFGRYGKAGQAGNRARVTAAIYTSRGELLADLSRVPAGAGIVVPHSSSTGSQIYFLRTTQGDKTSVKPLLLPRSGLLRVGASDQAPSLALAKSLVSLDTLQIAKGGFLTRSIPVSVLAGTRAADTLYATGITLGPKDQWQNVTPPGANLSDNGVLCVVADPINPGTVYVALDKGGIRKSTDCGNTWVLASTGKNSNVLNTGGQWVLMIDFVNPQILYTMNLYGSNPGIFKSINGGVDWESILTPDVTQAADFVQHISMDPTDHNHLSVNFHEDCSGAFGPMCMVDSRDAGATWRMFKGPINGWSEAAGLMLLSSSTMLYTSIGSGVYYSGDNGASWSRCDGAPDGKLQNPIYRTKDGVLYLGSSWGALRSYDGGRTWAKAGEHAPGGEPLIGDGNRLFSGRQTCCGTTDMFSTATESIGTDWQTYPCPGEMLGRRSVGFAYDHGTNVLYAAITSGGVWRVVTK